MSTAPSDYNSNEVQLRGRHREGPAAQVLAFTGSGISVAAGLSAFSTPGGLYERARLAVGGRIIQTPLTLF